MKLLFSFALFAALANGKRRRMMDLIRQSPGCNVNDLSRHFQMSRIAVMKHLKVLVDAGLVISKKSGRSRELYFNAAPIQMIYDRWSDEYSAFWTTQAVDLKYAVEGGSESKQDAETHDASAAKDSTKSTRQKKPEKKAGKGRKK